MVASLAEIPCSPRRFRSARVFLLVSSARASLRHADQPKVWDCCTRERLAQRPERQQCRKSPAKQQAQKPKNKTECCISSGSLPKFHRPCNRAGAWYYTRPLTLTAKNFVS